MAVSIKKLEEQLMSKVDTTDLVQVEKVERYMQLVRTFRKMNTIIRKEGESITVINGSQQFVKAHPLIGERNKINSSLLSIEKSFGFKPSEGDGYSASDLV